MKKENNKPVTKQFDTRDGKHILVYNKVKWKKGILISTPTLGLIRYEWATARFGQVIPVNWEAAGFDPFGFSIDDAYNLICKKFIEYGAEWLLIIEDDTIPPPNLFLRISEYMDKGEYPIVSGLYYTKSQPAVPLIFRGRGNGAYTDWEIGDIVMCDGLPMGCLLIHRSIIEYFYNNSPVYNINNGQGEQVKQVFLTPRKIFYDPEKGIQRQEGTQDLYFFDRLIEESVLKKTGWSKLARRKYPLLCDTSILCKHIDINTGRQYP